MYKKKLLKSKSAIAILLAITMAASGIGIGVIAENFNNKTTITDSISKSYASNIDSKDVVSYIKASTYVELDNIDGTTDAKLPITDLYNDSCITAIITRCKSALDENGTETSLDTIKNTLIDVSYDAKMTKEAREHVALKVSEQMADYVANLNLNEIDKTDFCNKVQECIQNILKDEKDDIDLTATITNSKNDVIKQILIKNGMDKNKAEAVSSNLLTGITVSYKDQMINGANYLNDEKISEIANKMSEDTYNSVSKAITTYNKNVDDINNSMNSFSEQYLTLQKDIKDMQTQITLLEKKGEELSKSNDINTTEYVTQLTTLNKKLSDSQSELSTVELQLAEFDNIKQNLTFLAANQDSAKYDFDNSIESLKSDINNTMLQVKTITQATNSTNAATTDEFTKIQDNIESTSADLSNIISKLDADKLTTASFDAYKTELSKKISDITKQISTSSDNSNGNMKTLKSKIDAQLNGIEKSLSEYQIANEAKTNADKEELNKNIVTLKSNLEKNKIDIKNSISALNIELDKSINNIENKIGNNDEETKAVISEIRTYQNALNKDKISVSEYQTAVNNINSNISLLEKNTNIKLDSVKNNLQSTNDSISQYKTTITSELNTLNSTINSNKNDLSNKMAVLNENLGSTIDTLDSKVDKNNETTENALQTLKDAQNNLSATKVSVNDYETAVVNINSSINILSQNTDENFNVVKADISNVNDSLSGYKTSVNTKIDVLSTALESNNENDKQLANSVNSLNTSLSSSIASLSDKVSEQNNKTTSAINNIKTAQEVLKSDKVSVSDYTKALSDINTNIDVLQENTDTSFDTVKENISKVNSGLNDYKSTANMKMSDLLESIKENGDNDKQLADSVNSLNMNLSSSITTLDAKVDNNNIAAKESINTIKAAQEILKSDKVSVSDYTKALSDINTNIDVLQENTDTSFDTVKEDISKINSGLNDYKSTANMKMSDLLESIKKNGDNDKQLADSMSLLNTNLSSSITTLDTKIDTQHLETQKSIDAIKSAQNILSSDKVSVSDYEQAVSSINTNINKLTDTTGLKFSEINEGLNSVSDSLSDYKGKVEEQISDIASDLNGNEEAINSLNESITNLENSLSETINSLSNKVDSNNANATAALNTLKEAQKELTDGKVSVKDYDKFSEKINNAITVLESKTSTNISDLNNVKTNVLTVNNNLNNYKKNIDTSINGLNSSITNITNDVSAINTNISNLQTSINKANTSINGLNSSTNTIKKSVSGNATKIQEIESSIDSLKKSVSDGKSSVAAAITKAGISTAANADFSTLATNITNAAGKQYNAGHAKGVTDADARVNANSVNYKGGYSAGVTAADARTNTNSTNYKSGYSAGVTDADNRANTNSINYKSGYNAGYSAGQQKSQLKTVDLYYNQESYEIHANGGTNPKNSLYSKLYDGDGDNRDWTYQFWGYTNTGMDIQFVQTLELSTNNGAQWVTVGYYNSSSGEIRIDTNRCDAHDMKCRIYYY